jgi:hypothetical protein
LAVYNILLLDLSITGVIKERGTQFFISIKREPHPTNPNLKLPHSSVLQKWKCDFKKVLALFCIM